jgi:hypothetical protein
MWYNVLQLVQKYYNGNMATWIKVGGNCLGWIKVVFLLMKPTTPPTFVFSPYSIEYDVKQHFSNLVPFVFMWCGFIGLATLLLK